MALVPPPHPQGPPPLGGWHVYGHALAAKGIQDAASLRAAQLLDGERIAAAIGVAEVECVPELLREFFDRAVAVGEEIAGVVGGVHLDHVGLSLYTPLELLLEGLAEPGSWPTALPRQLGPARRFPASRSYEARHGARAEICRVAMQRAGRPVWLELFDHARPAPVGLPPGRSVRRWRGPARGPGEVGATPPWHFALLVSSPTLVERLHLRGRALAALDPVFVAPFVAPVWNEHDRSLHTKLVNLELDAELEILCALGGDSPLPEAPASPPPRGV